jgi:hypothetical protein
VDAIAFTAWQKFVEGPWVETIAVFRNSVATPIVRSSPPDQLALCGWTADGRNILYGLGHSTDGNPVFEIPAAGGTSRPTGLRQQFGPNVLTVSPDGRHVAYTENLLRHELRIIPLPPD